MGSWIGTVKRYVSNVQNQISNLEDGNINTDLDSEKKKSTNKEKKNEQK